MTVSEQIIQVIEALCAKFGVAIDWTGGNVIPHLTALCRKLVSYEIWTSVFWIVLMAMLTIASIIATKKLSPIFKDGIEKDRKTNDDSWTIGAGCAIAGLCVLYIIVLAVICVQVTDIIKCTVCPEMYIFEYFQKIIKAVS